MAGGGLALALIAILLIGGLVVLPMLLRGFGQDAGGRGEAGAPPSFGPLAFQRFQALASEPPPTPGHKLPTAQTALRPALDAPDDMVDALIDVRRVEGRIKAASLKRFAELVDRHPEAVSQAMRRWLNDHPGNS